MKIRIVVFSSLFPSPQRPLAGIFIKERMFRVGKKQPVVVVSPQPWFPLQGLIRLLKPEYRPQSPGYEVQDGIEIYRPRFLAIPGLFRQWDGLFMALASYYIIRKLDSLHKINLIDSHFAYPDGYAASLLGGWMKMPVSITLRGTEVPMSKTNRKQKILSALQKATKVVAVANFLKQHVVDLGADANKISIIGNGVDIDKFKPVEKGEARKQLNLPADSKIIISVGGMVERKGFHRVIECLPEIRKKHPDIIYIIAGGSSGEGNWRSHIEDLVDKLDLRDNVKFLGEVRPEDLSVPLSCADIFVLSTSNEGWANVFLEAMACGLPVISTNVGGNSEVVSSTEIGNLVAFGDKNALTKSIIDALNKRWDQSKIINYARDNNWDKRTEVLLQVFSDMVHEYKNGKPEYQGKFE